MKRLLLSTTLIFGTLTGVMGSGSTHMSVLPLLAALEFNLSTANLQSEQNTLKMATQTSDAEFFVQQADAYNMLKNLVQEHPQTNRWLFGVTATAWVLSFVLLIKLSPEYRLLTMAPIAGALTNRTLDFIIQGITNYSDTLKTWSHTVTYVSVFALCAISYICLGVNGLLTADSKAIPPLTIIPITGGLTLKVIDPALKLFSHLPYTQDIIRKKWKDRLSDAEKIQAMSTLLAYVFHTNGISSKQEKEEIVKYLLDKGSTFASLQQFLP